MSGFGIKMSWRERPHWGRKAAGCCEPLPFPSPPWGCYPRPMHTPPPECPLCPRLVAFRAQNRAAHPGWHNAPVAGFGDLMARLAIVGLAPGLRGANRTGRVFTGDGAGDLLFAVLGVLGLARGDHGGADGDGLVLADVFVTNAVACVPPGNRPLPAEVQACRPFLAGALAGLPNLRAVLALGAVAHQSSVKALGGKLPKLRFAHGAVHRLPSGLMLVDSYHCSRLNQNTGVLTAAMLRDVVAAAMAAAARG